MVAIDSPTHTTSETTPLQVASAIHSITPRRIALTTAATLAGLSAGFFFTYQISVTRGLAIVDDETYVQTFQAINDTVRNAPFGIVFFGTVPALALATAATRRASRTVRFSLAASLALAIATVVITFVGNVPLNEQLGEVTDLSGAAATAARASFESDWNRLNLARTLTSFGAAVFAVVATVFDDRA